MTDEEIKLVNAAQTVAGSESGKILLDYLSGFCGEKANTFVCNPVLYGDGINNAAMQNMKNGKRAVIIRIRELIETDLTKPKPEPVKDDNYIPFKE